MYVRMHEANVRMGMRLRMRIGVGWWMKRKGSGERCRGICRMKGQDSRHRVYRESGTYHANVPRCRTGTGTLVNPKVPS